MNEWVIGVENGFGKVLGVGVLSGYVCCGVVWQDMGVPMFGAEGIDVFVLGSSMELKFPE
jgi:hypothetical protein